MAPDKVDYNALRAQTMGTGNDEEAVTVNTRALIDKILARYAGEWTVLRELLQNAADASASKVTIRFETIPSTFVPVPQTSDSSALLRHTLLHHTLKRLIVTNDGQAFGANDWSRLKRIAEGNPDETKIGAFGVGFYSVFADCEEPFVSSGNEAMAFYWKGNSLFTRRLQITDKQLGTDTSFVLDYRNNTSPVPGLLPLSQFLASSITFTGLSSIELWLDDWTIFSLSKLAAPSMEIKIPKSLETNTPEGLMQVQSVTREMAQLDARWSNVVGWKPKALHSNGLGGTQTSAVKGAAPGQTLRTFFSRFSNSPNATAEKAAKDDRIAQEAIVEDLLGECIATIFLHIHTATIRTSYSKNFSQELERATKKPPPKSTKIAILTSSLDEQAASTSSVAGTASKITDIFSSVLPSRSGRIYIGFPTHQTTGLNAHISMASVIPTVERANLDLNARWVRTWNMEMLRAAGIVCRLAWSGEIETIKEKLIRVLERNKRSKIEKEDINAVLPETIHMLNQFTFRESTPSSQVGSLIEEAFWTCNKLASIDILSSRGILPSQDVRIIPVDDNLSFVNGIPVLPQALIRQAEGFVKKLTEFGIISEITTSDIKKALEAQALDAKQLIEFLKWAGHKARINEIDSLMVKSLLDVTVAHDDLDNPGPSKLIVLSEIKHFINPSKIPANLPANPDTIPFRLTKSLERTELEALGWEDLQIVPWLRWLAENAGGHGQLPAEQDITQSAAFASQVLPVISKQWDGFSQSSRTTVIGLLSSRTVIPTKTGMRLPSQSYFPSVKLFDDLPVISNLNFVKEKMLIALGVRKTIELGLIFDRLLAPPNYTPDASTSRPTWSHVDLIKYLSSVRGDIPPGDVNRLRSTPLCPAESSGDPSKATVQRYRLSDLFEPNESLRSLGLQILHWPGIYRAGSDEGKFLSFLGLKTAPQVPELVKIMANTAAAGNIALRERALRYFVDHHHTNGYASFDMATFTVPYVPVQGDNPARVVLPTQCFTNEGAAIMGYDIVRKDLHPHANKFGVQANPPFQDCVGRLIKDPPGTKRRAREVFEYFATRLNEMNTHFTETLGQAKFVPVGPKGAPSGFSSEKSGALQHVTPRFCFLGDGGQYGDVFDYADFGQQANSFLLRCGSKHEPTSFELAQLVVREPARVFNSFQNIERYMDLLRNLADAWSSIKRDKALVKEMRKASFLLAYKEYPSEKGRSQLKGGGPHDLSQDHDDEDDAGVKTYQLASATDIVMVDDVVNYSIFKANILVAPMEERLEEFYERLGASSLSSLVEEAANAGRMKEDQRDAAKLQSLVNERIKLFLHDIPPESIRHDIKWLEKNVKFLSVQSLSVRKSLKGLRVSNSEPVNATVVYDQQKGWILYFTTAKHDLYHVSQALVQLLVNRPKPQHAMLLDQLLSTDLNKLKRRGYNVDRILRQKAAEARIADDQRKAQLEAEQIRINEQEAAWKESPAVRAQEQISMPGVFPDSPDRKHTARAEGSVEDNGSLRKPRGFFSEITRRFGIDDARRSLQPAGTGEVNQSPPPPYSQTDVPQSSPPTKPPNPVTAPYHLQQNLLSAVQSAQAYNSRSMVSTSEVKEVKETQTYCDAKPAQNITFHADTNSGIKIFLSNSLADKNKFMAQNSSALDAFASILLDCADVFALARNSVHIFYETNSSTIAFNQSHSLMFNYSYFENLHLPTVQQGNRTDAIIYWFVVFCHELAHNLVADHSAGHSYYAEAFMIQFFGKIAAKIAKETGGTRVELRPRE